MNSSDAPARYDHIDALRAIAALLVVWLHVCEDIAAPGSRWLADLALPLNVGGIGVMLFFMISGFVIPASLRADAPRGTELRRFVVRRFFRLYPAFWLSIPVALIGMWWLWGKQVSWSTLLANLTMAPQPFGREPIEGLYWTLLTELVFYLLCVGLFALRSLHRPLALALISLLFAMLHMACTIDGFRAGFGPLEFVFYTEMPMHLSLMFAAAMLRQWYDGMLPSGTARSLLLFVFGLWAVFAVWVGIDPHRTGNFVIEYVHIESSRAIGVVLFVVCAFWLKPTWPPLVALGRASYSLYLLHRPIISMLLWLAAAWPAFAWLHADLLISLSVVLVLSIAAAGLAYRYVEVPFIELGRRLSRPDTSLPKRTASRLHA